MDEAITAIIDNGTHEDLHFSTPIEAQDCDEPVSDPSLDINENVCNYPLKQDLSTGSSSSRNSSTSLDSPSSPPSITNSTRKRKNDCSCSDLETASKRVENTGASLDKDFTPELVSPPPVSIEDDDPNDLEPNITDEEDDNIPSLKPMKHAIIYSDEESEEDNHKEAEESDESLEEAAANTSEAHTDNAETNSQPKRVKIHSVSSSSIMKEEIEFWSSYLGKIKKSFHPTARKVGICPILTGPYDIQWRPL